ncbi:uncharacterized protein LOC143277501 [Babylonia areolata]|uniref:uncharacterized protein LOC143277501 n=1 Tax=Babylonia areolata TaxID=304850 RepID=UPI003FD19B46
MTVFDDTVCDSASSFFNMFVLYTGIVFFFMLWPSVNASQDPPRFSSSQRQTFRSSPRGTLYLRFPVDTDSTEVALCWVDTVPSGGRLPFTAKYIRSCKIEGSPPNCTVHASLTVSDEDPTGEYRLHVDNGFGDGSVSFSVDSNPGVGLETSTRHTTTDSVTTYVTTHVTTRIVTVRNAVALPASKGSDDLTANDVTTDQSITDRVTTAVGSIGDDEDLVESNPSPSGGESGPEDPSSPEEPEEDVSVSRIEIRLLLGAVGVVFLLIIVVGTVLGVLIKRRGRQDLQPANSGAVQMVDFGNVSVPCVRPAELRSVIVGNRSDGSHDSHCTDNIYDLIKDGTTEDSPWPPAEQGWSESWNRHHRPRHLPDHHQPSLRPPLPPPADNRPPLCHITSSAACTSTCTSTSSTTTTPPKACPTRVARHPGSSSTPEGLPPLSCVPITQGASPAAPVSWCTCSQRSLADTAPVNRPQPCLPLPTFTRLFLDPRRLRSQPAKEDKCDRRGERSGSPGQ